MGDYKWFDEMTPYVDSRGTGHSNPKRTFICDIPHTSSTNAILNKLQDDLSHTPYVVRRYRECKSGMIDGVKMLLLHGTAKTSVDGILSSGFDVSKIGDMLGNDGYYGKGSYFLEHSPSVINYSAKDWRNGVKIDLKDEDPRYFLVCEVAIGKSRYFLEATPESYGCDLIPGYDSHRGPLTGGKWPRYYGDNFGNEYCIFNKHHVQPILVVEIMNKKYSR